LDENSRIINDKINNERRNREHAAELLEESFIRRVTDDYDQIRDVAHEELVKTAAGLENKIGTLRQALDAEIKAAQDRNQRVKENMELQLEQQYDKSQESMCEKLSPITLKIVDLERAIAQVSKKSTDNLRQASVQLHADVTSNINNALRQFLGLEAAQKAEFDRIGQKLDRKTMELQNEMDNFKGEAQRNMKHMADSQRPLRDLRRRPNPDTFSTFSMPQYGLGPAAVINTEMATTHGQHAVQDYE